MRYEQNRKVRGRSPPYVNGPPLLPPYFNAEERSSRRLDTRCSCLYIGSCVCMPWAGLSRGRYHPLPYLWDSPLFPTLGLVPFPDYYAGLPSLGFHHMGIINHKTHMGPASVSVHLKAPPTTLRVILIQCTPSEHTVRVGVRENTGHIIQPVTTQAATIIRIKVGHACVEQALTIRLCRFLIGWATGVSSGIGLLCVYPCLIVGGCQVVMLCAPYIRLPIPVTIDLANVGLVIEVLYKLIKLCQCCHFCPSP